MGQAHDARSGLFTGWRGALLAAVLLILLAVGAIQAVAAGERYGAMGAGRVAWIGLAWHAQDGNGWVHADVVDPRGAAARAGIVAGDTLRLSDPFQMSANVQPGTRVDAVVRRAGNTRTVTITYLPRDLASDQTITRLGLIAFCGSLFLVLLGILVVVRGWGQSAALALGVGLAGVGGGDTIPVWFLGQPWTWAALVPIAAINLCSCGLIAFAPLLYARHVRRPGPIARLVIVVITLIAITAVGIALLNSWAVIALPRGGATAMLVGLTVGPMLSCWYCARGVIDADPAERNRFAAVLIAFAVAVIAQALVLIGPGGLDLGGRGSFMLFNIAVTLMMTVIFPLIMAYAVLRQRVIDISFAINRTVVFGTVSVLLLGTFGLIEWGIEHLLPEEWVKASVWLDAGAAVGVYLMFHRVHDWVEHRVERVFFHQWQANEDALRAFVAIAPHYEDAGALARGFAEELARFGGGARVAFYRRQDGALDRVAGNWDQAPRHFREDDRAFATLRATRRPLDLTETETSLPGALALPIIDHGALTGLVLIDAKGNGGLYRPDEIALLVWATHEVGLAMAALHVGLVESELRLAKAQLARLTGLIGDRLAGA